MANILKRIELICRFSLLNQEQLSVAFGFRSFAESDLRFFFWIFHDFIAELPLECKFWIPFFLPYGTLLGFDLRLSARVGKRLPCTLVSPLVTIK